jgi:hypothetical protein
MFAAIEGFLGERLGTRQQTSVSAPEKAALAAITIDPGQVGKRGAEVVAEAQVRAAEAVFAGGVLRPATLRYAYSGEAKGKTLAGHSVVTIAMGKRDRRDVVTIDEQSQTQSGAGTDTTVVDRRTLLPLDRSVRRADFGVDLAFSEKAVTGQLMRPDGQDVPISARTDGAVLTDGMPMNLALTTLPLREGYVAQVRAFATSAGAEQKQYVVVKGVEPIETPAGTFEAYRVLVAPCDALSKPVAPGSVPTLGAQLPGSSTVWIEKAAPHRVLRWERILADGSIRAELMPGGRVAAAPRLGLVRSRTLTSLAPR